MMLNGLASIKYLEVISIEEVERQDKEAYDHDI